MNAHAITVRLRELDRRMVLMFVERQRAVELALAAQKERVDTALIASEKRLNSMNEFRGTLTDQAATFITRREFYTVIVAVATLFISAVALALQYGRD